ncbi:MAG TPA: hypothetical protein VH599_17840 [Ktedonobacterales bacterium]|jgi:hypothetical protein
MIPVLPSALLEAEPITGAYPLSSIALTALLDFAGLSLAIWTLWSSIWLQLGGHLLRAFRLISVGSLAFALSHLLDTILQFLAIDAATLIHQGAALLSVLFFLPGLAGLADAIPAFNAAKAGQLQPLRFWPIAVGLIILISAGSFVLYGVGEVSETAAFIALDGSLVILGGVCLALVVRARLGGPIGRSLWLSLLGLLLFGLAHPAQVWFYEETNYPADLLGIVHRLIVIPAFFLFAISITSAARSLNTSITA